MSLAWAAYRLAAPALGALAPAARPFAGRAERALWDERLGRGAAPGPCDAWLHAASLGEATAALALARELEGRAPGVALHLTATTRAGRARLAGAGREARLAPLDAPQPVARFLDAARPRRLFVVETELWPHWLMAARERGIPAAFVSARLAARSVARYRALGPAFRGLLGGLAAVLAQTAEDAGRWLAIGAPAERTAVTGNLKNDALPLPAANRAAARRALGLDGDRPLLVLGSVRPGEARALAAAWLAQPEAVRCTWQVAALPRHARADAGLRAEAAAAGVAVTEAGAPAAGGWRWESRTGVLTDWYAAADAAFVGGSLVPLGGHNPLEPAATGAAVLVGPHHESQRAAVEALAAHGAVAVAEAGEPLAAALRALLEDGPGRARRAAAGLAVAGALRGAARDAVARLEAWGLWPA